MRRPTWSWRSPASTARFVRDRGSRSGCAACAAALALGGEGEGPSFARRRDRRADAARRMQPDGRPVAARGRRPGVAAAVAGADRHRRRDRAAAGGGGAGPSRRSGLIIDLRGSYGGAQARRSGPPRGTPTSTQGTGKLSLRAEQFSLGRIADVLPPSVLTPENTTLDAALDLDWAGDAVRFGGELAVVGLSLQTRRWRPIRSRTSRSASALRGTGLPAGAPAGARAARGAGPRHHGAADRAASRCRPGTFKFANGRKLDVVPEIDARLHGAAHAVREAADQHPARAGAAPAGVRAAGDLRRRRRREDRLRRISTRSS